MSSAITPTPVQPTASPIQPSSTSAPPNNVASEAVPSVLLLLLVFINIVILITFLTLRARKKRERKRKWGNFIVRMSDLKDEFAEEIVYTPTNEGCEIDSGIMYVNFEMIQKWRESKSSVKLLPDEKAPPRPPKSWKVIKQQNQTQSDYHVLSLGTNNVKYDADIESSYQGTHEGDKGWRKSSNLKKKSRLKVKSKKKQGQAPNFFAEASMSMVFSSNDAYSCESDSTAQNGPTSTLREEQDSVPNYTYIDHGATETEKGPNYTYIEPGRTNTEQGPNYTYIESSTTSTEQGPNYTYIESSTTSTEQGPNYTYIEPGTTSTEQGPNYTYIEPGTTSMEQRLNYTYIENGDTSLLGYTYIDGGDSTSKTSDTESEYVYVDSHEPPYYSSVAEQSTEYYANVAHGNT